VESPDQRGAVGVVDLSWQILPEVGFHGGPDLLCEIHHAELLQFFNLGAVGEGVGHDRLVGDGGISSPRDRIVADRWEASTPLIGSPPGDGASGGSIGVQISQLYG